MTRCGLILSRASPGLISLASGALKVTCTLHVRIIGSCIAGAIGVLDTSDETSNGIAATRTYTSPGPRPMGRLRSICASSSERQGLPRP